LEAHVPTPTFPADRRVGDLPEELLHEATRRLGLVALVWVGLAAFGIVLNHVVTPLFALPIGELSPWSRTADVVALLIIAVSGALWYHTRRLKPSPGRALDLALGYEVLLAFGLGLVIQWHPQDVLPGRVSWICLLVLLFPMIVPNTPRKTLIASLLAASMDPLGILIAHWLGLPIPSATAVVWNSIPNYLCAVLAVIPSVIITRLGREVHQARELGSYRLVELIGRGGMGEVWRATHRMLARPAAVKLISPDILGAPDSPVARTVIRRFRREAEAASMLESPHTIRLYDFGETRAGTFYFAMELLDGLDLETLVLRYGPLPAERTVQLLRQVCHSLGEAHARGLIHRDVKPANIYVCRLGREYDFVKVLDFGLVTHDPDRSVLETAASALEPVVTGTPAYMAPEVVNGASVDRRADLYALGCVAYWLLTGTLVFEAGTPLRMLMRHLQDRPVPPSERAAPVPHDLERLILRCLEKRPDDRPASADEILAELDRMTTGPSWDQERARTWWCANVAAPGGAHAEGVHRMLTLRT
jgi:serine/threonine-protein kinase